MWLARCRLTTHEPIFYATREIGRLYETGRYLHNYALTYALGLAQSPFFNPEQIPHYAADLRPLNAKQIYVSPAQPLAVSFQLATFKYGEEILHVEMQQATKNTPSFGKVKEIAPGSRFECFVLSAMPLPLPRWIRLGKWHSKVRLEVEPLAVVVANKSFACPVPLNPLDIPAEMLRTFDIISMPPSSLVANARLEGECYDLGGGLGLPKHLAYGIPQPDLTKKLRRR